VNDLTTISIRLSDEEKEALQKFAKEHDLTIS
jgi:predicted transcriptional regulator